MFVHAHALLVSAAAVVMIVSIWLGIEIGFGIEDGSGRATMMVVKSTGIATAFYHADDHDHDPRPLVSQPLSPAYAHHNHIHSHSRLHSRVHST